MGKEDLFGSLNQLLRFPAMAVRAAPVSSAASLGPHVYLVSYLVEATKSLAACRYSSQDAGSPDQPGTPSLFLLTDMCLNCLGCPSCSTAISKNHKKDRLRLRYRDGRLPVFPEKPLPFVTPSDALWIYGEC